MKSDSSRTRPEPALITMVDKGGPADRAGVRVGDRLKALNGVVLRDVIDYRLIAAEERLTFDLEREGRAVKIKVDNEDGRPLGLLLEKSVFDRQKTCQNKCAFCFIDQLPPDCRPSLYIKDDDYRLSFLYGNFVTLTNLSRSDLERIVEQRLSPLYVSIHSTDAQVRRRLISPPETDRALENLKFLLAAGIEMHIQIVAAPGFNDGDTLEDTLDSLERDFSETASVGIVPVGLTGHRGGLPPLRPFTRDESAFLVEAVNRRQKAALAAKESRWVFAADEFYLMAGSDLPPASDYEEFAQIENGIGLARRFIDEITDWAAQAPPVAPGPKATLVTAPLAACLIKELLPVIAKAAAREVDLIVAENNWLGGDVSVAGLLSGSDVGAAIDRTKPGGLVFIPDICLNPDGVFLDDLTVGDIAGATGADIIALPSTGWAFMEALSHV